MREIWLMQPRFSYRQGKRATRFMAHPRFRAAYDFLCLRAASGENVREACDWWTRRQQVDLDGKTHTTGTGKRSRRRRGTVHANVNA
jgi:poly(A) polymerase